MVRRKAAPELMSGRRAHALPRFGRDAVALGRQLTPRKLRRVLTNKVKSVPRVSVKRTARFEQESSFACQR